MRFWWFVLGMLLVATTASIMRAEALPMAGMAQIELDDGIVLVRDGCGPGWRRGAGGQCMRDEAIPGLRWSSRSGFGPKCRYRKTPDGRRYVCR